MNIVNTETLTLEPGVFTTYTSVGGAETVVFVVFGEIDEPETLRVRVYGDNNMSVQLYLLEDETLDADPSNGRGYQTVPIPLVDSTWTAMVALLIDGGTTNRDFTVVTIAL